MNLSTKSSNTITRNNDEERLLPRLVALPSGEAGTAIKGPHCRSQSKEDMCMIVGGPSSSSIKSLDEILQLFKMETPGLVVPDGTPFGSIISHKQRRSKKIKRLSMPEKSLQMIEARKLCRSLGQLDLEEEEEDEEEEDNQKKETSTPIRLVDYSRGKARLETTQYDQIDSDSLLCFSSSSPSFFPSPSSLPNSDDGEEREMSLEEVFGLEEPTTTTTAAAAAAANNKHGRQQAKKLLLHRGCSNSSTRFPATAAAAVQPNNLESKLGSSLSALDLLVKEDEDPMIATLPAVRFRVRRNRKLFKSHPNPTTGSTNKPNSKRTDNTAAAAAVATTTTARKHRPTTSTTTPHRDFSRRRSIDRIPPPPPAAVTATTHHSNLTALETTNMNKNKLGCSLSALDWQAAEEEDDDDDDMMSMMAASMSDLGNSFSSSGSSRIGSSRSRRQIRRRRRRPSRHLSTDSGGILSAKLQQLPPPTTTRRGQLGGGSGVGQGNNNNNNNSSSSSSRSLNRSWRNLMNNSSMDCGSSGSRIRRHSLLHE